MTATIVEIPGTFSAKVEHGRITGYTFTPHASNAGYFGESILVMDGNDIEPDKFFEMIGPTLMVSNDKSSTTFTCEWAE